MQGEDSTREEAVTCGNHQSCLKDLQLKGRGLLLCGERDVIIGGEAVPWAGGALLAQAVAQNVQKLARACAAGLKQQTLVRVYDCPACIKHRMTILYCTA